MGLHVQGNFLEMTRFKLGLVSVEHKISKIYVFPLHSLTQFRKTVLIVTISATIDAIDGYVMLVKTSKSLRNVLKVLSHVKVIKSNSLYHAALTM